MIEPVPSVYEERPRPFRKQGLGYIYEPDGIGVRLSVDRIVCRGEDMTGELLVTTSLPGKSGHLHRTRANLLSTASRKTLAGFLAEISGMQPERPWIKLLEEFFVAVLEAERIGEPFVIAGKRRQRPIRPPDTVAKILPARKPTSIFAPGGSGKGYVVIGMCACIQAGVPFAGFSVTQGNVLYLDWEDDLDTFEERLWLVSRGMGFEESVPLHYRLCRGPLRSQVYEVARYIDENNITMVVIDSFGKAAGSSGEHGTYESVANQFDESLRQLGPVTSLVIDHVDGASVREGKMAGKAIGSIYKMNWVRQAWEVMKQQDLGSPVSHLGLYHAKGNHSGTLDPIGLSLDFSNPDAVYVQREEIAGDAAQRSRLPTADQIAIVLSRGARFLSEIVEETGEKENTISKTLQRRKDRFVKLLNNRWGLAHLPSMPAPSIAIVRQPVAEVDEDWTEDELPWPSKDDE